MEDIVSSTQGTSAGGGKKLNKFQYNAMAASSRPDFLSFDFDENMLENLVESKFEGSHNISCSCVRSYT